MYIYIYIYRERERERLQVPLRRSRRIASRMPTGVISGLVAASFF